MLLAPLFFSLCPGTPILNLPRDRTQAKERRSGPFTACPKTGALLGRWPLTDLSGSLLQAGAKECGNMRISVLFLATNRSSFSLDVGTRDPMNPRRR